MEGNDPIMRAKLVVKLQYLHYFRKNISNELHYTGESGIERGQFLLRTKIVEFQRIHFCGTAKHENFVII
jgi:hypothetical protein